MELTLFTQCFRSNLRFSHQGDAVAHFDRHFFRNHDLVVWTDGSVSFFFATDVVASLLAACTACNAEFNLFFGPAQFSPDILSSLRYSHLFWSRKPHQDCQFFCRSPLLSLCPYCVYLFSVASFFCHSLYFLLPLFSSFNGSIPSLFPYIITEDAPTRQKSTRFCNIIASAVFSSSQTFFYFSFLFISFL